MQRAERMVSVGEIALWTEEFGDPADPSVLLVMGSMSQGLLWPEEFIGLLVAGGRRVIRYDHRDVGRSTSWDFAAHPYTWHAVKDDVVGLLDALGIERAHVVGHSAGGLLAQWIAVEHPERVATLTAIASSPLGGGEGQVLLRALTGEPQPAGSLPGPAPAFVELFAKAAVGPPPEGRAGLIDFQVEMARMLHGTVLPFDEDAQRRFEELLWDRAADPAALGNHRLAWAADPEFEPAGALGGVRAPTLVVEGTEEPVKPGHGRLIAEAIPGAGFLAVEGMGHTLPPEVHEELAGAILRHTSQDTVGGPN
ncbi:alpha/beta fold hydrolase [Streptomyces sp. NPDC048248]|uniref:alpha/beta fold hydrolase n=1 Tax=Streptomyces sp. NPDC048248 TaxID=3365523 RepID=UPI00371D0374